MSVFEPEPQPSSFTWPPRPWPSWTGPPANVLPRPVGISAVIGRTADVVVALVGAMAYPQGVELQVAGRTRRAYQGGVTHAVSAPGGRSDDGLQLAVQLGDGPVALSSAIGVPGPVRLLPRFRAGAAGVIDQTFWLWPLPAADESMTLFARWSAMGLVESHVDVDGAAIRGAAAAARELWPLDVAPDQAGRSVALPPAGPQQPDSTRQQAERVREAFEGAFGSERGPDLDDVVEDGARLAGALAQARQAHPEATGSSFASVREVVFLEPDLAGVAFAVHYNVGMGFGEQMGYAVLHGGRWKVSFETFARVLGWAGVVLPPSRPAA